MAQSRRGAGRGRGPGSSRRAHRRPGKRAGSGRPVPLSVGIAWTVAPVEPPVKFKETSSAVEFDVELDRAGAVIEARIDGAAIRLGSQALADGAIVIDWDGVRVGAFAARMGESIAVSVGPQSFIFKPQEAGRREARHSLA